MRRVLWVAIGFLLALGGLVVATRYYAVDDEQLPRLSRAQRAPEACPDASDAGYHYAPGVLIPQNAELDAMARGFYAEMILSPMSERPLWCGEVQGDTIRLINSGTSAGWISVRATRVGKVVTLSVVVLEGVLRPPPSPGMSPKHSERLLSQKEWKSIEDLVDTGAIWNLEDPGPGGEGYSWILELRSGPAYHFVRGVGRGGGFGAVARQLMGLALVQRKTTICWVTVWDKSFSVAAYLNAKAEPLVRASSLHRAVKDSFLQSDKKLRAITIEVRKKPDLEAVRELIGLTMKSK